ncbi:hypothetical protein GCM10009764_72350 [Nocardia ninae]|uniref:Uncharacterized protein n=1 Tax=Nocardia ninae NBRC 108245 TaxID=1210091 RepID=A0A511MIH7_9NOCA|nr:hypothetical protein NN4_44060 [Nocardia ninae NBRC 108245]
MLVPGWAGRSAVADGTGAAAGETAAATDGTGTAPAGTAAAADGTGAAAGGVGTAPAVGAASASATEQLATADSMVERRGTATETSLIIDAIEG